MTLSTLGFGCYGVLSHPPPPLSQYHLEKRLKIISEGTGKVAQWVRALAAFLKDPAGHNCL